MAGYSLLSLHASILLFSLSKEINPSNVPHHFLAERQRFLVNHRVYWFWNLI